MNLSDWIASLIERFGPEQVLTEIGEGFSKASNKAYEQGRYEWQRHISDAANGIWAERNRLWKEREHRT